MNIIDCHLHSDLSFDSREPMELYVKKAVENGDEYFITTEHLDLESCVFDGGDIAPDFERQAETINRLNAKYPIKVLWGIEIGWRESIHNRNLEISCKYPFDMIILSIHETEYADVSFPDYMRGRTVDECYDEYLGLAIQAVESFDNFDTFAHVDYLLRYIGDTDLEKHTQKLSQLFTLLINKGKALEINTKMFPEPESVRRRKEVINLYVSLGGKRVTLGSDGHSTSRYKNNFDMAKTILKDAGISSLSAYIGRKEVKIPV